MADEADQNQEEVKETVTLWGWLRGALREPYPKIHPCGLSWGLEFIPFGLQIFCLFFLGEVIKRLNAHALYEWPSVSAEGSLISRVGGERA